MATPTVYVICDQNCRFEGMTKEQILTAITQAVQSGTIGDIDTGFISTVKTINGTAVKFFYGSQSDYNELSAADKANLFKVFTDDKTLEDLAKWKADIENEKSAVPKAERAVIAESADTPSGDLKELINIIINHLNDDASTITGSGVSSSLKTGSYGYSCSFSINRSFATIKDVSSATVISYEGFNSSPGISISGDTIDISGCSDYKNTPCSATVSVLLAPKLVT